MHGLASAARSRRLFGEQKRDFGASDEILEIPVDALRHRQEGPEIVLRTPPDADLCEAGRECCRAEAFLREARAMRHVDISSRDRRPMPEQHVLHRDRTDGSRVGDRGQALVREDPMRRPEGPGR